MPAEAWKRTLWIVVLVQFTMSASINVTEPVLPLFLPQVGVVEPNAVKFWSGVLSSMNFLMAALVSPFWGIVADRYGRKLMVIRTGIAVGAFTALMGLSHELWQLITLRALMGMFSGFYGAAIALVATQVPDRRLGYALGWLATGQMTGTLAGPLLGGAIADFAGSYRIGFFVTAALAAVAVTVMWVFVREEFVPGPRETTKSRGSAVRALLHTPGLAGIIVVLIQAQFGVRSIQPLVSLYVQELVGPVPLLATLSGIAFSVTGLADLLVSPLLGKRSDTIGYRRVLLISLLGGAVACLPQAFVTEYWQFVLLRFALGMFIGGTLPVANALLGRVVAAPQRGLAYGLGASATQLGSFLGPITGGSVAAAVGIRWVFVTTAMLFALCFVWAFFAVPRTLPATSSPEAGKGR
jgi:DHA1 family multidrug resistance protein-like MFS transporter